jgi:hypothetical protein
METKQIDAEIAIKMTETEFMDAIWEAPDNSILEIFAADPDKLLQAEHPEAVR